MSSIPEEKTLLRSRMRGLLGKLTEIEKTEQSNDLLSQFDFADGQEIAIFANGKNEPRLLSLIAKYPKIRWYLPKVQGHGRMKFMRVKDLGDLQVGAFGLLEPQSGCEAHSLHQIICPGIAFTKDGSRLGQGGGYYDRALRHYPLAKKTGVAFTCQTVETIPREPHDFKMDQVISPNGTHPDL